MSESGAVSISRPCLIIERAETLVMRRLASARVFFAESISKDKAASSVKEERSDFRLSSAAGFPVENNALALISILKESDCESESSLYENSAESVSMESVLPRRTTFSASSGAASFTARAASAEASFRESPLIT